MGFTQKVLNELLLNEFDEFSFLTTTFEQLNRKKETLSQINTRVIKLTLVTAITSFNPNSDKLYQTPTVTNSTTPPIVTSAMTLEL